MKMTLFVQILSLILIIKKSKTKGSFGVVYELTNKENDNKYAMKIINKEKVRFSQQLSFIRKTHLIIDFLVFYQNIT